MRLLVVSCAPVVSSFTLSLACLLLTAITVHNTCSHSESFPLHPLVVLRSAPSASVHHSVSKHTQTHTLCALMLRLRSCLCLFLHPLLLPALFRFFFFASLSHKCSPAWCVNSGGTWHLAPLAVTCQSSHLINISLLFSSFSFILSSFSWSLIVFPPRTRCRHSTSSPPPTALVRPCPGGTGGASGSQGLWATSVHTPGSHVWTPNSLSRGQPSQSTGGRGRRPGDGPRGSFCRRPKAHND